VDNDESAARTRRVRRRYGVISALIVGPVVLLVVALRALDSHDYPAGDLRNEPQFWILSFVAALILVGILVRGSIRELIRGDPGDRPDSSRSENGGDS
jgi:cytochrome bd-type quinol oxidase subunit 2